MRRCEQIDAVIPPAKAAGKLGNGHHFNGGDADLSQVRQMFGRCAPASLLSECAGMHLVEDLALKLNPWPSIVRPPEARGIHDFGRSMGPLRLKPRSWVRESFIAAVDTQPVCVSRFRASDIAREIASRFPVQTLLAPSGKHHRQRAVFRRPNAKMRSIRVRLRADGVAPREVASSPRNP